MYKEIVYTVLISFVFFILVRFKIPVICDGCEKPNIFQKTFFRCVNDTGPNSKTCEFQKNADKSVQEITRFIGSTTDVLQQEFNRLLSSVGSLPQILLDVIYEVLDSVVKLKNGLINNLKNIKNTITMLIDRVITDMKNAVYDTFNQAYEKLVAPIIEQIINKILSPVQIVFDKIKKLKGVISEEANKALSKIGEAINFIPNEVIKPIVDTIKLIPNAIKEILTEIVGFINTAVSSITGAFSTVIKPIEDITDEARKVVNPTFGVLKDAFDTVRDFGIPSVDLGFYQTPSLTLAKVIPAVPDIYIPEVNISDILPGDLIPLDEITSALNDIVNNLDPTKRLKEKIGEAKSAIDSGISVITQEIDVITLSLKTIYDTFFDNLKMTMNLIISKTKIFISDEFTTFKEILQTSKDALLSIFEPVVEFFLTFYESVKNEIIELGDSVLSLFKDTFKKIISFWNDFSNFISEVSKYILKNFTFLSHYYYTKFIDETIPMNISVSMKSFVFLSFVFVFMFASQLLLVDDALRKSSVILLSGVNMLGSMVGIQSKRSNNLL